MIPEKDRVFFCKAYGVWWVCLALLGGLFVSKPSPSFIEDMYLPVVWNVAGFAALLLATAHTVYRERINAYRERIKAALNHRIVSHLIFTLIFSSQSLQYWERMHKKSDIMAGFCFVTFGLFAIPFAAGFVSAAYEAVAARFKPRSAAP